MDHVFERTASSLAASGITEAGMMELLRQSREPAPTPTAVNEPAPAPADAEDDAFARAKEALAADERRTTLVDGAKAILRQRHGQEPQGDWSDDELIYEAGLSRIRPNETPAEKARREHLERDAALLADPAALARHQHEQAVATLRRTWWQLGREQRTEQLEALGINPADWTPPANFNGTD
jgi:hypothetical protein